MRKTAILLTAVLAGCSGFSERYKPGVAGKLDFQLSNGFWADRFDPATPIAVGGTVILEVRAEEGPKGVLVAKSSDSAVIETPSDPVQPGKSPNGTLWRCPLRAVVPGRARIEMRDSKGAVDIIELSVAVPAKFDWEIYDPDRKDRRAADTLRLKPGENLEISIWAYDAEGKRFAGAEAWTLEAGATSLLADPAPDTPQACTWEIEHIGARTPVRFTGKVFGSTEVIVKGPGGGPELKIVVKVDLAGP
ncbi:MAG: hypothetical protein K8T20_03680 [Planctomycetes bacterium]|nr:hypothetical protein [Planctomycetota bacterium]